MNKLYYAIAVIALFFLGVSPALHEIAAAPPQPACFGTISSPGGQIRAQRVNDKIFMIGGVIANPFLKSAQVAIGAKDTPPLPHRWFNRYSSVDGTFGQTRPTFEDISSTGSIVPISISGNAASATTSGSSSTTTYATTAGSASYATNAGSAGTALGLTGTPAIIVSTIYASEINFGQSWLSVYKQNTWSPIVIGATVVGTPAYTGTFTRIGNVVNAWITLSASTTFAASAGTTTVSLPYTAATYAGCPIVDNNGGMYNNAVILATQNVVILPVIVATGYTVIVSGSYITNDTP